MGIASMACAALITDPAKFGEARTAGRWDITGATGGGTWDKTAANSSWRAAVNALRAASQPPTDFISAPEVEGIGDRWRRIALDSRSHQAQTCAASGESVSAPYRGCEQRRSNCPCGQPAPKPVHREQCLSLRWGPRASEAIQEDARAEPDPLPPS